jgi:hypothetical protein
VLRSITLTRVLVAAAVMISAWVPSALSTAEFSVLLYVAEDKNPSTVAVVDLNPTSATAFTVNKRILVGAAPRVPTAQRFRTR